MTTIMRTAILTGQILSTCSGNQFELLNIIGCGGCGEVYKARQCGCNTFVAVKIRRKEKWIDWNKRTLTLSHQQEVEICSRIAHSGFARLIDSGYDEKLGPFTIFEYIEGETLSLYLAKNRIPAITFTANIMNQLLHCLIYLHSIGIVHRDLKPQNIMLTGNGSQTRVKILDFGISSFAHNAGHTKPDANCFDSWQMGSPAYCAPEQWAGSSPNPKSDIYAWALILLECLFGKTVLTGKVNKVHFGYSIPTPVQIPLELKTHPLGRLLKKMLNRSPHQRPSALTTYEQYSIIDWNALKIENGVSANSITETPADTAIIYQPQL